MDPRGSLGSVDPRGSLGSVDPRGALVLWILEDPQYEIAAEKLKGGRVVQALD